MCRSAASCRNLFPWLNRYILEVLELNKLSLSDYDLLHLPPTPESSCRAESVRKVDLSPSEPAKTKTCPFMALSELNFPVLTQLVPLAALKHFRFLP